jgi:hypothetical protein
MSFKDIYGQGKVAFITNYTLVNVDVKSLFIE